MRTLAWVRELGCYGKFTPLTVVRSTLTACMVEWKNASGTKIHILYARADSCLNGSDKVRYLPDQF